MDVGAPKSVEGPKWDTAFFVHVIDANLFGMHVRIIAYYFLMSIRARDEAGACAIATRRKAEGRKVAVH